MTIRKPILLAAALAAAGLALAGCGQAATVTTGMTGMTGMTGVTGVTGATGGTCAIDDAVRYTLTGVLPAPGTVCRQNSAPFPAS